MGLLQKAVETYDSHIQYAGEHREDSVMMAPIAHMVANAHLEITLDREGRFDSASAVDKSEPKIVIPVTESSAGRSGTVPRAHPLCDQIGYLIPKNETKYRMYVDQLSAWEGSQHTHPKLTAILRYVNGGTILTDLAASGLVKLNDKGMPTDEKLLVRWRVLGDGTEECWLDEELFRSFTRYYEENNQAPKMLCMVTGEETLPAKQHLKGIIPISGNAKLISANDFKNFTYRGRFFEEWQAASVGYEASQKAHNALRWLVQEQGAIFGGRTFLCWNPQGRPITPVALPFLRPPDPIFRPSDYRDALRKKLAGWKAELEPTDGVVLAAFDAATTGRLALTYYNELQGHDFLQRLHDWDERCAWQSRWHGIQSPSLSQIVNCAFGTQQKEKEIVRMKTDDRVMRQQMQRLIACRVDRAPMGADIVKALVSRASNPLAYEKAAERTHDEFGRLGASNPLAHEKAVRETILFTACAVIRKYRYDRYKEEWEMALEPDRNDRSYQFGRLLAVMEKVERDTYDGDEGREPNAIRMQSVFCQRPMYAASILEKQLERAYFPRLKPPSKHIWYKHLIGQIMEKISAFPQEEWNKPLEDSYLMGYYLQRSALYTSKNDNMEETNHEHAE